jgi:hypothetical protein
LSIEISLEEVKSLATKIGFVIQVSCSSSIVLAELAQCGVIKRADVLPAG